MLTKTILAAGALLSMAAAVPMQAQNKRDVVWETKIEEEYVTVDVTTTVWLNPGETPPVVPVGNGEKPGHYGHGHHGNHHTRITSHIKSTITVPAPSEQPTGPAPSPSPETTSSYVAPAPTTSTWVAPTTSTPAPVEPTPSEAPPAHTPPASSPAPTPSSGGGSAPSGQTYTGDLTYYTPGMGSCGIVNSDSDSIVALAEGMMSAQTPPSGNPNDNPLCGKSITISYGGKTATAKIMDTCPGCANGGLDLTPSLFQVFAPLAEGRLTGMKWWYN